MVPRQSFLPKRLRLNLGKTSGDGVMKKAFGGILEKKLVVSSRLPTIDPLVPMLNELSS